jgi:hypothetical protein
MSLIGVPDAALDAADPPLEELAPPPPALEPAELEQPTASMAVTASVAYIAVLRFLIVIRPPRRFNG